MTGRNIALLLIGFLLLQSGLAAQSDLSLTAKLPQDPAVRTGTLPNGLRYYIRQNDMPKERAELRLALNAGSILEKDDQRGLAHFVEHMAFNGTERFAENELVTYLESIGMRFGADLNAYTSFDETVYMLQVPTDNFGTLDTGVTILREWAGSVAFDSREIDAERGVVVEEWRARRSGDSRIGEKHFADRFFGSRYADRLPIGLKEVLDTFQHDRLIRFYRDWYRPDLMAIIAVGDFDPDAMEAMIRSKFSDLKNPAGAPERPIYSLEPHANTVYSVAYDPEASNPSVGLTLKRKAAPRSTVADYRRALVEGLAMQMLSERYDELRQSADPPFVFAYAYASPFGRSGHFTGVEARVKDGEYERGLRALLGEIERVKTHGFTETELERQKASQLSFIKQAYNERDKTESARYAREYVGNFTDDESYPGIEFEYKLYQKYVPEITLAEVNQTALRLLAEGSRVITVGGPEHEGMELPNDAAIASLVSEIESSSVAAYEDAVSGEPLMAATPKAGKITAREEYESIGATRLELSNGATVWLKKTDFKNDEILFSGFSPGGTSLVNDEDYIPASTATAIVTQSGLGPYDRVGLGKYLSDKVANVSPGLNTHWETISGQSSVEDFETMMQMAYLYFTEPKADPTAMAAYRSQMEGLLQTKGQRPESVFFDTVGVIMSNYHYRSRPWTVELLDELDMERSIDIYSDRFGDAGDFTFLIVGNYDDVVATGFVEKYLASLPSKGRQENWRDLGMEKPDGKVMKVVYRGTEPKSMIMVDYHDEFQWSNANRWQLTALGQILGTRVRETIREELGGAYSPYAGISVDQLPKPEYDVIVQFGCDPEKVDMLLETVYDEVEKLRQEGVTEEEVSNFREMSRRERETNLRENSYWMGVFSSYIQYGLEPTQMWEYDEFISNITREELNEAASRYLATENRMTFVLYPEEFAPGS